MSKNCRGLRCKYLKMFNIDGKTVEGYEIHHIIPRSKGGTNDPWNLILLPSYAHKIIHMSDKQYRRHLEEIEDEKNDKRAENTS